MSAFPNGINTREDAIRLLRDIDGREDLETGPWDIDDFASAPNSDPKLDACRIRVRDELITLLSSNDPAERSKISPLIGGMIKDLEVDA